MVPKVTQPEVKDQGSIPARLSHARCLVPVGTGPFLAAVSPAE